jgi:hypothetical protein
MWLAADGAGVMLSTDHHGRGRSAALTAQIIS